MGLFDFFKSKKKEDVGAVVVDQSFAAPKSNWSQRFSQFGDLDEARKLGLVEELLQEIAPAFGNAKVKRLPDDDEIEMRGRIDGMPMRVNIEYDMGWVRPEFKIENRLGPLELQRDHSAIAKAKADDDDWADEDELRVFVAKGIYVEGDEGEVNETSTTMQALPAVLASELLAGMESLGLSRLNAGSDSLSYTHDNNVDEMSDPVREISAGLRMAHKIAVGLGSGARDMSSEPKIIIKGRVEIDGQILEPTSAAPITTTTMLKCTYCSSQFVPLATTNCPNCGAAHSG